MSIKHLVHCDGPECERAIPYSPLEWGGNSPLPDDWYLLTKGDRGMEPFHFCSLDCIRAWGQKVKRGPFIPDRYDRTSDPDANPVPTRLTP